MRTPRSTFDALDHGLWARFAEGDRIDHAAWLRAGAEGGFVGSCRRCGDYLTPLYPDDRGKERFDYEAHCRRHIVVTYVDGKRHVEGCGAEVNAPGGRLLRKSGQHNEMPRGWWDRRLAAFGRKKSDGGD